ncbi:hypothetical protein CLV46_0154 [Diaminobutyricimonas aerilata]|uniref:Uncharacterized protein n=1 Tax=Diaminobutyricimonas aerilata TaxID=1162967 RepID=A0A2M9CFK7_9MICO|nr:hypothetical protein [Diaminobutyricimonas aerilata]PJJ70632.1 hypothetical protein CLV46_0154 [Diaminobutyricimonas aerilata]
MDTADWIEHRRDDGEIVGWIRPVGEDFQPIDLLGHEVGGPVEWLDAERVLEERGLRFLADPYTLRLDDGTDLRVRITQVSRDRVVVKRDDWGDIGTPLLEYTLPFPAPEELRPLR